MLLTLLLLIPMLGIFSISTGISYESSFFNVRRINFPVLNSSIISSPISLILCMLVVSSDMSTFTHIHDIQEIYKDLIHNNNMNELANAYSNYKMQLVNAYSNYKMQLVSNFNVLDISNSNNIYKGTTLNSFNEGKIYLHTPRIVNIGLASIVIMKTKYIILPCLVFIFVPLLNIFIDSLDTLIKSLLESSKLF